MCTIPSRDRDGSTLPTLVPKLNKYQNKYFAIQALLYSKLDQMWDGSAAYRVACAQLKSCFGNIDNSEKKILCFLMEECTKH